MNSTESDVMEKQFTVGPDATLVIQNFSGSVSVAGGSDSSVRVRASGPDIEDGEDPLRVKQLGNRITITTEGRMGPTPVDYVVTVPPGTEVRANTVEADLTIQDTRGAVDVQTVNGAVAVAGAGRCAIHTSAGDIVLDRIEGGCDVTAVSGDIQARAVAGELVVSATNGDVTVSASRLTRTTVQGINGDINLETSISPDGQYELKSNNGDVQLLIPPDARVTAALKTRHGDLSVKLPGDATKSDKYRWQGTINGGGARVTMESSNGDVRLDRSDRVSQGSWPASAEARYESPEVSDAPVMSDLADVPEVPDVPDIATDTPGASAETTSFLDDRTVSILRQLEEGNLTVDEAMRRLDEDR